MTFSIVARDPATGDLGVAVQSRFLAVGGVVPWARADAGAIATQAWANLSFGPDGLALLAGGADARSAGEQLIAADERAHRRQLGIVDGKGAVFAWTGPSCIEWAGHEVGDGFACQGNTLAGPGVISAMAEVYRTSPMPFPERLIAVLAAGQAEGGDARGEQAAAIYVAREGGSYGGTTDRYIDLRVDDHAQPITELARLLNLHRLYFEPASADRLLDVDPATAREIAWALHALGQRSIPEAGSISELYADLERWAGVENLEGRLVPGERIDPVVLDFLRRRARRMDG
ncbi:MAG: DUF1028 domain-containing protein [Dehalococcoidia bacterium]|nr:DUF1028 domain-containing protein [Dehalococcoidia bacterium]